jgi:hypothetical protein
MHYSTDSVGVIGDISANKMVDCDLGYRSSIPGGGRIFIFAITIRQALGSTQPLITLLLGAFSSGSIEFKSVWKSLQHTL